MARRKTTRARPAEPPVGAAFFSEGALARLGLYGYEPLEPVLLAALVTEEPLLLIGAHGTGKSLLLTRVAEALGLPFRHYNASLLNFDDLVGFPLPNKDGSLEYVRTPAAIWGAGAVIFDEISRCRPDIQNKLFPVIHERRVQGLPLEGLRYRWAAMNPPNTEAHDSGYLGSEPLDPALADRFAFVVQVPAWASLSEADQLRIISAGFEPVTQEAAACLLERLERIRQLLPVVRNALADALPRYVQTLVALIAQAGVTLSPRRAAMLCRSIVAVHAAALAADASARADDSAWLALLSGLPQRAEGKDVAEAKLLAAHREAWRLAGVADDDPLRVLLTQADPLERLRLAASARGLAKSELSSVVADALATLAPGARAAAAIYLFESNALGRLNAAVAEQAADLYRDALVAHRFSETIQNSSTRYRTWNRLKELLAKLDPDKPREVLCANALAAAFGSKVLGKPEDVDAALAAFQEADLRLSGKAA
ncbi:MAG: AAA family ATPase [Steroidobacteraceae bacterium]